MSNARHAVVLGAGIAGLLAARVLTEHFGRVTVIERDTLGDDARRGVPQGRHLHGLLDRGRTSIEQLFPGFTAEMSEHGATTVEALVGTRWYIGGLRAAPTATGLTSVIASRPLLESVLRQRTTDLPQVRWAVGTAAGLVGDSHRVRGVAVRAGDETYTLTADLVVDATGRGSRVTQWLAELGALAAPEERLDVDLGYASRLYEHRPEHLDGHSSVIISTGPNGRGGGAVLVEGGRWQVTLAGMLGDHPPTDKDGFAAFAETISSRDIHEIISTATPLGAAVPHRFRSPVWRRFDRLPTVPQGFLAIGDALCHFNPLYAQGMTVAAQQTLVLRSCLRAGDTGDLPERFYSAVAPVIDVAWRLSTGSDLANPAVVGPRDLRTRLTNRYVARAQRAAHYHPSVARAFLRVANLVDPPAALLAPSTAWRILMRGSTSAVVSTGDVSGPAAVSVAAAHPTGAAQAGPFSADVPRRDGSLDDSVADEAGCVTGAAGSVMGEVGVVAQGADLAGEVGVGVVARAGLDAYGAGLAVDEAGVVVHGAGPAAHEADPAAHGAGPAAHEADPAAHEADPGAHEADPGAHAADEISREPASPVNPLAYQPARTEGQPASHTDL
ncbi:FAD-dependent oxidoreductase [Nocardia callitridis]|uniref:Uncharacterized protein n=1 Tax=Nocardia callitridis TaxID=648753 RepID=A0ABP9KP63_9NOCA